MGFNQNTGVYTPASGALTAAAGQVVQSAVWDNIFTDMTSAFTAAVQALQATYGQRNIIGPNGGMEVWQRGAGASASFTVNASTTSYTADRWYLNTGANEQCTVAAVAGLTNQSNLAAKVTRNSGQTGTTALTFGFPLDSDEIAIIKGQLVALSFVAKIGANFSPASNNISVAFNTGTGSPTKFAGGAGYAGAATPISATQAITTSAVRYFFVSTAIATTTAQAEVTFSWTPVGTAGADDSITIDNVQLEVLPSATTPIAGYENWPFERMLAACKRHYWKTFLYGTAPVQNPGVTTGEVYDIAGVAGATTQRLFIRHPVSIRTNSPVVVAFNPAAANGQVRDESASADCSATAISATSENLSISATGNGATAVGNLLGVHLTVDAGI